MLAGIVVVGACLLLAGYAVRKRALWRSAMVVVASAALVAPLTALPSQVASAQGGSVVSMARATPFDTA